MLAIFFVAVLSCSDEETFSVSKNVLLEFEADTIRFDTVFTDVPSSTRRFKIYNRDASHALRIVSVRLSSGGTSGFRINVDGHSGSYLTDIEIEKKDSLFLFSEVTLPHRDIDTVRIVRDSILFDLESGVRQQIILEACGQDVRVLRQSVIDRDSMLSGPRPYLIYDSLVVAENATLTILPGTTLCFHQQATLRVHGRLVAEGTVEQLVTLRGDRTDKMFSYLPYENLVNQWGGIDILPESHGNELDYLDLHGSQYGIRCHESTDDTQQKLTLSNSVIHNVSHEGLSAVNCRTTLTNCQISNAGLNCLSLTGGTHYLLHTTIAQFYPWSANHGTALQLSDAKADEEVAVAGEETEPVLLPFNDVQFINCIITGSTNDEISISRTDADEEQPYNVHFQNCLVNIRLRDDDPQWAKDMFTDCVNESDIIQASQEADEQHQDTDGFVYGRKNFRLVDYDLFLFDFQLDSVSNAIGLGNAEKGTLLPYDRLGREREGTPDAGCYQYIPIP